MAMAARSESPDVKCSNCGHAFPLIRGQEVKFVRCPNCDVNLVDPPVRDDRTNRGTGWARSYTR